MLTRAGVTPRLPFWSVTQLKSVACVRSNIEMHGTEMEFGDWKAGLQIAALSAALAIFAVGAGVGLAFVIGGVK